MDIGDRIAELRKKKEMSQEMLAGKLDISFQAVSKWENNISYPDIKLIPKIANILECSIGYLFGENDKNCDSILIDKLPNDDTMRIVVARGKHILSSDEIENEGKRITVNLEDMANCGDVIITGNVVCGGIYNCADVKINGNLGCNNICNCADIYAHGEIGSTNIANCVSVSGNQKMIED